MLKRKVTEQLVKWKRTSRKALLVTGARQIGKSYAIREFGKSNYRVYFEANLLLNRDMRDAIVGAKSATDFINRVSLLSRDPLVEGDTLIFIDEIQEYPEAITLMKALVEDGRYSFAFSGSMLGTQFKGISSFPVGSVEHIVMRPLDFEEFCWAIGVSDDALARIEDCVCSESPVEGYIHDAMMRNFRAYMVCGGMPEVVQNYVDSGYSLVETRRLQSQLVEQYGYDIGKYAGNRAFETRSIFDRIPVQLESENRRFVLSSLGKGSRMAQYEQDFLWLVNAGVGLLVPKATEAKSPLKRTESASSFKFYESDTGMLVSRYPQSAARSLYLDMKNPNFGGIYENVVAQELAALGIPAWYYQSNGVGEVDFIVEGASGAVVPIEVKSGRKVKAHAALDALLGVAEYKIRRALILSRDNVSVEGKSFYVPLYATYFLDKLTGCEVEETPFTFAPVTL